MAGLKKAQAVALPITVDLGDGILLNMQFRPHAGGYKEAQEYQRTLDESVDDEATQRTINNRFIQTVLKWDLQDFRCPECNNQLDEAASKCPDHPEATAAGPADSPGDYVIPLTSEGFTAADIPTMLLVRITLLGYEATFSSKKHGRRT